MDWPVVAGDFFVRASAFLIAVAVLMGAFASVRRAVAIGVPVAAASLAFLSFSWRHIPGGPLAALAGHLALVVCFSAWFAVGRVARRLLQDRLAVAMASLVAGMITVAGIFAMAPLTENLSAAQGRWLLFANPLVAVSSAAGIDLLHLDTIYRTSPLAHRGVELPAWTTACAVYAVVGLAAVGASRIRPWSPQS